MREVMTGKGKAYSEVAREIEASFHNWLLASGINESDFISAVDGDDLYLTFWADNEVAITVLHKIDGEIAMPLIWQKGNGIRFESYKVDTALLLLYVAAKCGNIKSKEKIRDFAKEHLRVR